MVTYTSAGPTFTPKHRWSTKNNALCGICLFALLELIWRYRQHVDWRRYWQRVLFLTLVATFNSCLGLVEMVLYSKAVAKQPVHPRPIFILGHPRTGTTLLHNLLSLDDEFGFCSTFCAGFPSSFLWFERFQWMLAGMVDDTRPMDNMPLSLDVPQEDELAVNVLTAGTSPYAPLTFMTAEPSFRPFFSFREAPQAATRRWIDAFLHVLRKLSYRANGRRLLLKSPAHTGRVELLLKLFPDAQFVYIHREPEAVYLSACHMADTQYWFMYLKQPTDEQVHEFILNQFEVLWHEYEVARELIPKGNLVEVAYSELSAQPVQTIGRIYSTLGLPGWDRMRPKVETSVNLPSAKRYQKNVFDPLPPSLRQKVAARWAKYSEAWGYRWSKED